MTAILHRYARSLSQPVAQLRACVSAEELDRVCGALAHMHANRLLGTDPEHESTIVDLAVRTRKSLEKAPFGGDPLTRS